MSYEKRNPISKENKTTPIGGLTLYIDRCEENTYTMAQR